ncbi:MAG TPA: MFS transporter, partial [Cryomorphaceae bacterium]|nr:MFS transporter [Cryomorphaceae bacterium]
LVFTIIAISLIDKLGRKPLLVFGVSGIAICMFLLAYGFQDATYKLTEESMNSLPAEVDQVKLAPMVGTTYNSDIEFKAALRESVGTDMANTYESQLITSAVSMNAVLILIGILGFVACFAISIGPVMWVLFSELFPNWIRGLAISFVGLVNSGVSFSVQLIFPWELENLGSSTTFLIYGIFAALGLVFIIMKIPETKGRSLEELEAILVKEPVEKP